MPPNKFPGAAHATVALLLGDSGWKQYHLGACQVSGLHLRLKQGPGLSSVHTSPQPTAPRTRRESDPPGSTLKHRGLLAETLAW